MTDKKYIIKEIFYSIQGEGFHSGRPAVFIRFSGCNLWSGREENRASAICKFCDTDFVGTDGNRGGIYTKESLLNKTNNLTKNTMCRFIVFTGGEPSLQIDEELIFKFKNSGYTIAVETNGTMNIPAGVDWITVSPKSKAPLIQKSGDELKLVFPQENLSPHEFENLDFKHFYLQPKDDQSLKNNTHKTLEYCLNNPKWKLSLQLHKVLEVK